MDSAHKSRDNTTTRIRTRSSSRHRRKPFSDLTNTTPIPSSRSKPVSDSKPASDQLPAIPSTAGRDQIDGEKTSTPKYKVTSDDCFADDDVGNNNQNMPKIIQLPHSSCKTQVDSCHKSNGNKIDHIQTRSSSRRKRKPFLDVTNANPSPLPKSILESKHVLDTETPFFSTAVGEAVNGNSTSTPIPKDAFVDFCDDVDNNDISTINSRRAKARRKGKEKVAEAAAALSCPPLGRIASIGSMKLKAHVEDLHRAFSDPGDKNRKRMRRKSMPTRLQKPILPPDFVEKQKAYFAEIDAFELPEEEVEEVSDDALE